MRQRLAIANALLMPRDLLVLDEPTNGLDPQGTREVRHLIGELADDGVTMLVSSHLLAEVDQMCSHVGVMYEGRLVSQGSMGELRTSTVQTVRVDTDRPEDAARVLRELGLSDVLTGVGPSSPALLGDVAVEKIVPDLVNDGVPVLGLRGAAAQPGGRVRRAHRGGLRCQRLRCWRSRRPGAARSGPPTRFLRSELMIIFGRRRNLAGLGVLAVVPIILAVAVRVSSPGGAGGGPDFISAITGNGLFVAFAALSRGAAAVPAPGGRARSPGTRWPARPTWARCVICSPSRPGGPGCWSSSTPRS